VFFVNAGVGGCRRVALDPTTVTLRSGLPSLHGYTIMLVEDNPETAELVTLTLRAAGAVVYAAQRVQHARTMLASIRPHVIVSDLALPEEDGIAFAAWVRAQPVERGGGVAMIAYTAHDAYFHRAVVPGGGFAAIVKKPSDPRYLCDVVADVLRGPRR
jgi:DNA-binding response OmpR family regulator